MKGSASPVKRSCGAARATALESTRPPFRPTTTTTPLAAGWFGSRAPGRIQSRAVGEDSGQRVAERGQVLRITAGDDHARAFGAGDHLLVHPDRARVPQIGAQARPR